MAIKVMGFFVLSPMSLNCVRSYFLERPCHINTAYLRSQALAHAVSPPISINARSNHRAFFYGSLRYLFLPNALALERISY